MVAFIEGFHCSGFVQPAKAYMLCNNTVAGERLSDDEVDQLLQGIEDNQGQVNYEGEGQGYIPNNAHQAGQITMLPHFDLL